MKYRLENFFITSGRAIQLELIPMWRPLERFYHGGCTANVNDETARGRLVGQVAIKSAGRGSRREIAETDFREETAMGARGDARGVCK